MNYCHRRDTDDICSKRKEFSFSKYQSITYCAFSWYFRVTQSSLCKTCKNLLRATRHLARHMCKSCGFTLNVSVKRKESTWKIKYRKLKTCAVLCLVAHPCLTLQPMDCSPPGSSVHGDSPCKNTQVVAMPSSRGSPQPRARTQVSNITGRFFTIWATRKAQT